MNKLNSGLFPRFQHGASPEWQSVIVHQVNTESIGADYSLQVLYMDSGVTSIYLVAAASTMS